MKRTVSKRQAVRQALLLVSLLLFPITLYYFSPALILQGGSEGIVTGSAISFALMFLASLLVGRLWCGWACPGGALGEVCTAVNPRAVRGRRLDWIKWAIWLPWISLLAFLVIRAGGYQRVDPLYMTAGGVSVVDAQGYIVYYGVVGLFFILSAAVGRRAGCHTFCWMAPFMILGRKLRNVFAWPSLRLQSDPQRCSDCMTCTQNCAMSLDVNAMVKAGAMEHSECILCGKCVDGCPSKAIQYVFRAGK